MSEDTDPSGARSSDLRDRLRQITQPLVDSIDAKLREQIDQRVDERLEALTARLTVLEQAIANLDRTLRDLTAAPSPANDASDPS